jgi:ATP-dependent Clp protease ATP-binding subunit ClpC
MFEKLTPRMRRVIDASQHIARDYGQDYVGTEHLLLAILREGTGLGARILTDQGIGLSKAKVVVDKLIKKSLEDTWVFGRLPGTPHFRNVMAIAIEEARQLESKVVCTEHLLLALAREEGSVAYATLDELGIRAGTIRREITQHFDRPAEKPEAPDCSG